MVSTKQPTPRETERGFLSTPDGLRLFFESDELPEPRGVALLVHGFLDHCGRYAGVVEELTRIGFSCYRFDYRGHGQSDGKRGHILAFDDYLSDLKLAFDRVVERSPDVPRFLLGHSNGGLMGLHFAAAHPDLLTGLVLSSPFFGFGLPVPMAKVLVARALSRIVPGLTLPTDVDSAHLSHDPDVVATYADDPLVGKRASSRWYTQTVKAQAMAPQRAAELRVPVLVQQGGDDRITEADATRRIFEQIAGPAKQYVEYEGLYHEIWFELKREAPLADLKRWLGDRVDDAGAG